MRRPLIAPFVDGHRRSRAMEILAGTALGLLTFFLTREFGLWNVAGIRTTPALVLLALLGGIVGGVGWTRWLLGANGILMLLYLLVALTPLIEGPAHAWIRRDQPPNRKVDAIVVLSTTITGDSTLEADAADRLLSGIELARAGVAPVLITTRIVRRLGNRRITSDDDQRRLVEIAGLASSWTIVDSVATTRHEAQRVARILPPPPPPGANTIAVVTAALHSRRACGVFERVGFRVYCIPARSRTQATWNPATPDDRLALFRDYFYERVGTVVYRARGWID